MQALNQHRATRHSQIIAYALKTALILFGVTFGLSYVYVVFVNLSSDKLNIMQMIISMMVIMITFVLGWLINKKHPGHTIALFFLIIAYSLAVSGIAMAIGYRNQVFPTPYSPVINSITLALGHTLWLPGVYLPIFLMPLYFPDGKLLSPRWRALVILILANLVWTAITIIFHPWPWVSYGIPNTRSINGIAGSEQFFETSLKLFTLMLAVLLPLIPIAVFLRYRRSQGIERIQMKWPIAAIVFYLLLSPIVWTLPELTTFDQKFGYPITWSMALLFPISIGIAIVRHRLFDIDIVINRTLVYGILTALIIVLYVAIVSGLGGFFQTQISALNGLIATGVIAVIFQPLRERLQRLVNRVLYGESDHPGVVFSRLAHHLETAETPSAILPNLVQTIAHLLKIPYVAIWLPVAADQMEPVVVWGEVSNDVQTIPLTYQNEAIGHLVVTPRGPHEQFSRHEQQLLATIAALTATTVRAVQLSDELSRSRQRIVSAREEERRRLRRDLHDGLGPQLASQTLGLEAVAQLMQTNPPKAQVLLESLKTQAQDAILDVRRLVYDLRPPALDDLGLIGALRQSASRYETGVLRFHIDIPQPLLELPAAVETAVYRIAQEAMTNVVRHAGATLCRVRLYCTETHLIVEVCDNGRGISQHQAHGVGLQTMKERTTELNGQYMIESLPDGGTQVHARLPLEV